MLNCTATIYQISHVLLLQITSSATAYLGIRSFYQSNDSPHKGQPSKYPHNLWAPGEIRLRFKIAYLQAAAEKVGLSGRDAIICYAHDASYNVTSGSVDYFVLDTVQASDSKTHMRWIYPNGEAKSFPPLGIDVNYQGKPRTKNRFQKIG